VGVLSCQHLRTRNDREGPKSQADTRKSGAWLNGLEQQAHNHGGLSAVVTSAFPLYEYTLDRNRLGAAVEQSA
jgi:hypothetical protein